MVKVSGALSGQIMVMYHHCAVPGPPRAASGPHGLHDGNKSLFPRIFGKVEASWSRTTRHKRALGRAPILISPYNIHHNTHMGHYNTHTE